MIEERNTQTGIINQSDILDLGMKGQKLKRDLTVYNEEEDELKKTVSTDISQKTDRVF